MSVAVKSAVVTPPAAAPSARAAAGSLDAAFALLLGTAAPAGISADAGAPLPERGSDGGDEAAAGDGGSAPLPVAAWLYAPPAPMIATSDVKPAAPPLASAPPSASPPSAAAPTAPAPAPASEPPSAATTTMALLDASRSLAASMPAAAPVPARLGPTAEASGQTSPSPLPATASPAIVPAEPVRPDFSALPARNSAPPESLVAAAPASPAPDATASPQPPPRGTHRHAPVPEVPAADTLAAVAAPAPAADAGTTAPAPSPDTAAQVAVAPAPDAPPRVDFTPAAAAPLPEARAPTAAPPVREPPRLPPPVVHSPQFGDAFGGHVTWLAEQRVGEAQIRVSPDDLGPIDIRLRFEGDRVHAEFGSAHAEVRAAIETHLPRLRELLGTQGLELSGAGVGGSLGQAPQQSRAAPPAQPDAAADADADADAADAPQAAAAVRTIAARGLFDAWA